MLGLQGCAWQTQACRPPECEPPAVLPGEMLLPLTFTSRTESFSSDIDLHRPPSCRAFRRSTPAVATCTGRLGGKRSVATHWIPLLGLRRLKDNFLTICKLWFSIYIYISTKYNSWAGPVPPMLQAPHPATSPDSRDGRKRLDTRKGRGCLQLQKLLQ